MLGGLKEKALNKAISTLEEEFKPIIQEKVELFRELQPADVNDDDKYKNFIINPLWSVVKMQSGGAIGMAQKFIDVEGKFNTGLFNVRNELIHVEDNSVALDPEFSNKIIPVLMDSLKA